MVAYRKDEIISVTELTNGFSTILNDLISYTKSRLVISKNNKLEAVVIPIEEYERMKVAMELMEHIEIYNIVKEREHTPKSKYISLEDMAKIHGIDLDEI